MELSEYIELIILARDSGGFHGMNFMAIFFAYIVANHIAGKELTLTQFYALSIAYSGWCVISIAGVYLEIDMALSLASELHREYPEAAKSYPNVRPGGTIWRFAVPGLLLFAWLFSMSYAITLRKKRGST